MFSAWVHNGGFWEPKLFSRIRRVVSLDSIFDVTMSDSIFMLCEVDAKMGDNSARVSNDVVLLINDYLFANKSRLDLRPLCLGSSLPISFEVRTT